MFLNRFTNRPFRPQFNVPEVFGEALSYEDQVLWLAVHFKELDDYVKSLDLKNLKDEIIEAVAEQNKRTLDQFMVSVDRRLSAMEAKVDGYVEGSLIYDPTSGDYRPSKETMRRVYAALVQSGNSHVHDMSDLTVEELSEKGTHAYSVAAKNHVDWSDEI